MSDLIPVSRKEQYLSKIDGMTNSSPDKTYTKEEYFFSEILGEAMHKPTLETRYEIYLAKIAGREIGIPYPETRLERFLAKAAGMDISVPTPITREEMYWSTYSSFYLSNASGEPPLMYNPTKETLNNYRIYGQTVDGESTGDKTPNLFDGIIGVDNEIIGETGGTTPNNEYAISEYIPVEPNMSYTYHFYHNNISENRKTYSITEYDRNKNLMQPMTLQHITEKKVYVIIFITRSDTAYIRINWKKSYDEDLMLNSGSTSLPYEPYGYKVPVTISNGADTLTTPIYLPNQIKKVGDEAEYIDFSQQKLHRVRKNLLQNTATSQTLNGVTFTVNNDGSVTCNGKASAHVFYSIGVAPFGNYILNGCPQNGSGSSYLLRILDNNTFGVLCNDFGGGVTANITTASTCQIRIASGYTCNNLTFYPMIRKVDIEDDTYEPYIENTDLDVTLPALPTVAGTNVLSVETEIQPSHVFVEFDKEREYG